MGGDTMLTEYGPVSAHFDFALLGELCEDNGGIQTGPFGSQLHQRDYVSHGTPIITVEHLGENRIRHENLPRVTDDDKDRLSRYIIHPGDIVFSRVGSVDRRSLVRPEEEGWLFSGRCLRVRARRDVIDPGYLSWFFGHPVFKEYIRRIAVGATMPSLNTKILRDVPIYFPPLPEQRAIAHILGSLDDKIELNRRMNETLEAMAQAIFKSWFVDFDPVRAKRDGRDTGLHGEIADLFPDSFEDSELGAIPRGWEESTIGENAEKLSKGTTPRKQDVFLAGDSPTVPFLKVRNISDSGEIDISSLEKVPRSIHERVLKRSVLKVNDVLFSIAGTIGRVTILPMELDDSNTNQAVAFIRPHAHGLPAQFIRLLLISDRIQFEAKSRVVQGVQANVSLTVLSELTFPKPSSELIDVWYRYCGGIFEQQMLLLRESRTLASLRDALLPKLISGEQRLPAAALELVAQAGVPAADKLIEGAGA